MRGLSTVRIERRECSLDIKVRLAYLIASYNDILVGECYEFDDRIPILLQAAEGKRLSVIGHNITVKLTDTETAGNAFVFEDVCPPGVGVPPHVHQREDEILAVLEGEFELFLDGKTFTASEGAIANFPRFVPHGFWNRTQQPARALFVVTPGGSFAKFFDELSALPSSVPPDPATVAKIFGRYGMEILAPQPA